MARGYAGSRELGFGHIAEALGPKWRSRPEVVRSREILSFSVKAAMLTALHRVEEAVSSLEKSLKCPSEGLKRFRIYWLRASKAAILEGFEVLQCGTVLRVAGDTRAF